MAIEQGLREGDLTREAEVVRQRYSVKGEVLSRPKDVSELLEETNSLLRRLVLAHEMILRTKLPDSGRS